MWLMFRRKWFLWRYRKVVKLRGFFVEPNAKLNAKYYSNVLTIEESGF